MNQRGFATVDYLFAFVLVSGFSIIVLTFSATLSMVEVVQYISFASARNFFAGNVNIARQQQMAASKFQELKANPIVQPLLTSGWFELPDDSFIVDANIPGKYPAYADYAPENPARNLF